MNQTLLCIVRMLDRYWQWELFNRLCMSVLLYSLCYALGETVFFVNTSFNRFKVKKNFMCCGSKSMYFMVSLFKMPKCV